MTAETTAAAMRVSAPAFEDVERVEVNGTSLAYRERGEGEPVVFVHGTASDLRTWRDHVPVVGEHHRAIAYSRRYACPNEDIPRGVDDQMLPHVDDLVAFLRGLDAAPAHLVGHSWGAFVCLLTAIRHPGLVRSLVLAEPPVMSLFVSTPPRARELLPLLARHPRTALAILSFGARSFAPAQHAFRRGDDEAAIRRFASGVLGPGALAAMPPERFQEALENVASMRAQLLGAGFPPLTEEEVRGVTVPTLLVAGERSAPFLLRLTEHLERLLPHAERITIPATSHRMCEEDPDAFCAALLRFLERPS